MLTRLDAEARAYNQLREALAREYELDPDDPAVLDTAEGASNLHDLIAETARALAEDEAFVESLGKIIISYKERSARIERRIEYRRRAITRAMEEADLRKAVFPDATISRRELKPRPRVVSEEMLPDAYWKEKIVLSPDMDAIERDIKCGHGSPPGVVMSNGGSTITITRK